MSRRIQVQGTNLTRDEQIIQLNSTVKCRLGQSKIQGVGVIALYDIKRGQKLYCTPNPETHGKFYNLAYSDLSKLFPEIRDLILERWPSIINGSVFQNPNDDAWLILFMNHQIPANYDPSTDTALEDIPAGHEVYEDYSTMVNAKEVYKFL